MIDIPKANTIFEPFKIKSIEPLPILGIEDRRKALRAASYNLFGIASKYVTFDLLTDSGTSAMSAQQWAGIMIGDESYAGSDSFFRFSETIQDITGMKHVIPTHQGRSAEALLCKAILSPGQRVLGNTQFDTTKANIESVGCQSIDVPCKEAEDSQVEFPFKGNVDLVGLEKYLAAHSSEVPFFMMTVTNNSVGGQPVSLENIKQTKAILNKYSIPLIMDAARFAENSYFIKLREEAYADSSTLAISQEMFSYADGVLMSSKKDAFANIGGFLAINNDEIAAKIRQLMVITEGFPTYGGLSGRDLEAVAIGLREVLDENYLSYRLKSVEYFGKGIENIGLKVVKPFGGHAVYIDAGQSLPHLGKEHYPAQSLSVALYEYIGLRSVEIGSVMFGSIDEATGQETYAPKELVRLAMPRRVYTQSHVDYMIEMMAHLVPHLDKLPGYKIDEQPKFLRHFTAKFSPLEQGPDREMN